KEIKEYAEAAKNKTDLERQEGEKEKTGVEIKGVKAINPATKKEIPIFIADYVLGGYGTGAIMAVPAHDERDNEFAKKIVIPAEQPKYLIFDFDGVIGDTIEAAVQAHVDMKPVDKHPTYASLEEARAAMQEYASKKPTHVRDHTLTPEALAAEYEWVKSFGLAMKDLNASLFEEFIDEILKIPNAKIAVVSSGSNHYVKPLIEKSRLTPTHVLAFEDHHSKEEKVEQIAKEWGVPISDVWYFTDTKADVYELENLLSKEHLIGCAWGLAGKEELESVLPREQVLESFADIHRLFNPIIRQVVAPYTVVGGTEAPRSEKDIVKFDAATAIIKHWEDPDLYYVVDFSPTLRGFVGGHVEVGETTEQTARREVTEESGYTDIKSVQEIMRHAYSRGYKTRKSREEECHDSLFLVELASDARKEIADKETKKGKWVKKEEVFNILGVVLGHHSLFFDHYVHQKPFAGVGKLVDSSEFTGLMSEEAKKKITEAVGGKWVRTFRLRDWLISRQRYWGAPIPVVYDPEGKAHAVPEEHLPWMLPTDVEFKPTGVSPLGQSKELLERTEKIFGNGWKPDIDTMDTFVCSSWYYYRFADPRNDKEFASKAAIKQRLPVDLYVGGAEHTVLHLMYARFFTKALQKFKYVDFNEPFLKLRHQGLILAEDGDKMSKSKGNVINPDDVSSQYGADTLRLHIMFLGPFEAQKPWSTKNILGVRRFLERVWKLNEKIDAGGSMNVELETLLHQTIKKVGEDIQSLKMNTAVSSLMILLNKMEEDKNVPLGAYAPLLQLLAPFAPHIAYELAEMRGLDLSVWPAYDPSKITETKAKIAVQINGKVRAILELSPDVGEEEALAVAREEPNVAKWLALGKEVRAVYVAGKIISFAVETT
ncbi:class I tRNA ligase family protein, partial [Acetobacteraceae bacterium]|nr:class I tRNA ligase family protein [Candidatus Parcubacteria bacterium]